MRIVLVCQSVEMIHSKRYRAKFLQYPGGNDIIEAEMEFPIVAGSKYYVLLKGPCPEETHPGSYVFDLLRFTVRETLNATDLQAEYKSEMQ